MLRISAGFVEGVPPGIATAQRNCRIVTVLRSVPVVLQSVYQTAHRITTKNSNWHSRLVCYTLSARSILAGATAQKGEKNRHASLPQPGHRAQPRPYPLLPGGRRRRSRGSLPAGYSPSVLLRPTAKTGEILDHMAATNAYGRRKNDAQNLTDSSGVRYVGPDTKRTASG